MNITETEKRLSNVLESMRFPLIFLVVIAHMVPFDSPQVRLSWDSHDIYTLVSEMISHNLARLSVRCYFLISGYYVFKKMVEWGEGFYTAQLQKKVRTLLIPYLLWNAILMLAITVKHHTFIQLGLRGDEGYTYVSESSWYILFWGGPINFPLWYLRDLICMTLLIPLFYYWFRYTKIYGLILLILLYVGVIELRIPGLSTTAFMFFGAGAYFAMYKKDLLRFCAQIRFPSIVLALILLGIATAYNGTAYHEHIVRLFILVGVVAVINVFDMLNDHKGIQRRLVALAPTTFFIYVVHEIYIINWLKGGWARLPIAESGWGKLLGYFVVPCLCIAVCIGLYYLLKRFLPEFLRMATGGRMSHYVFKEKESELLNKR